MGQTINVHLNIIYYQTFRSCPVITSLFKRMVRQLIVYDKQLRFCISMCQNLWNQKIGHRIVQTQTQWTIRSGEHSNSLFTVVVIRDVEHLKEVLQTCWEQIGQDVIDRAIGQFRQRLSLVANGGKPIEHRFD